jgi:hypothetical protein
MPKHLAQPVRTCILQAVITGGAAGNLHTAVDEPRTCFPAAGQDRLQPLLEGVRVRQAADIRVPQHRNGPGQAVQADQVQRDTATARFIDDVDHGVLPSGSGLLSAFAPGSASGGQCPGALPDPVVRWITGIRQDDRVSTFALPAPTLEHGIHIQDLYTMRSKSVFDRTFVIDAHGHQHPPGRMVRHRPKHVVHHPGIALVLEGLDGCVTRVFPQHGELQPGLGHPELYQLGGIDLAEVPRAEVVVEQAEHATQ